MVSGATIMSALLITGLEVRLERVLTPQANDINLVLGLGSHTLTRTFVADYIWYEKQNFVLSDDFPLCFRTIKWLLTTFKAQGVKSLSESIKS